jgi:hypothetical protein
MTLASELDEYLTEKRILVISALSLSDPLNRARAAELLSEQKGHVERDFVVQTRLSAKASSVVLIGKDGKEKLRRATPSHRRSSLRS